MDRGAWWAMVHGVAESQIRLSNGHKDTRDECKTELALGLSQEWRSVIRLAVIY